MNFNPSKWDWSQWLATIMFFILAKTTSSVKLLYTTNTDFFGGAIVGGIFTKYLPLLCATAVIISAVVVQLYVYGFYVDVTLEYIMTRLAIPAGIQGVIIFLMFAFSMPLKMSFSWKGAGIILVVLLLYALSIYICYQRVEFRMVDLPDLEQLEFDMKHQAEMIKEDELDDEFTKPSKRRRK